MAALAYVFPPLSGLVAYVKGSTVRTRFHGLQAVILGLLWPLSFFAGSYVSPGVTQAAFFVGLALVMLFLAVTALGKDPRIPLASRWLARAAEGSPLA